MAGAICSIFSGAIKHNSQQRRHRPWPPITMPATKRAPTNASYRCSPPYWPSTIWETPLWPAITWAAHTADLTTKSHHHNGRQLDGPPAHGRPMHGSQHPGATAAPRPGRQNWGNPTHGRQQHGRPGSRSVEQGSRRRCGETIAVPTRWRLTIELVTSSLYGVTTAVIGKRAFPGPTLERKQSASEDTSLISFRRPLVGRR